MHLENIQGKLPENDFEVVFGGDHLLKTLQARRTSPIRLSVRLIHRMFEHEGACRLTLPEGLVDQLSGGMAATGLRPVGKRDEGQRGRKGAFGKLGGPIARA